MAPGNHREGRLRLETRGMTPSPVTRHASVSGREVNAAEAKSYKSLPALGDVQLWSDHGLHAGESDIDPSGFALFWPGPIRSVVGHQFAFDLF